MKTYRETTQAILQKLKTEQKRRTMRKTYVLRTAAAAACCAVTMGVAVLGQPQGSMTDPPTGTPSSLPESQENGDRYDPLIYSDYLVDNAVDDVCLWDYNGKSVTGDLREWLMNHEGGDEQIKVYVQVLPHDRDISFGGVTLGQLQDVYTQQWLLLQKLGGIAKEGEDLRFGEKLLTEGNAEGIRWAKELYEDRISYYGEDFLLQYIQNGEFLAEKVADDTAAAAAEMEKLKDRFDQLYDSYCNYVVGWLKDQGCPVTVEGGRIVISVTADQFKNLPGEGRQNLTFRMYYPPQDDGAADQAFQTYDPYDPGYVIN